MNKGVIFTKEERKFIVPLLEQRIEFYKREKEKPDSVYDDKRISAFKLLLEKVSIDNECTYKRLERARIRGCVCEFLDYKIKEITDGNHEIKYYHRFGHQIIEKCDGKK